MKMWMSLQAALRQVRYLLYPPKCVFCGEALTSSDGFCAQCVEKLSFYERPVEGGGGTFYERCYCALPYEGAVRRSLLRYKFYGKSAYAAAYAALLAGFLAGFDEVMTVDVVTWVPVSRLRRRKRGYDQAELLACALAARLGKPCRALLQKVRDSAPQPGKGKAQRRANVLGAFAAARGAHIAGEQILLVDDIFTTGATMEECARILKTEGAACVLGAAFARTPLPKAHACAAHGGEWLYFTEND